MRTDGEIRDETATVLAEIRDLDEDVDWVLLANAIAELAADRATVGAHLAIAEKFLASALMKRQFGDTPDDTWQSWDIAAERFLRRNEMTG